MKARLVLPVMLFALLMHKAALAQTEYDIPDGTGIDYIFYNVNPPYTNTFFDDFVMVVGDATYTVNTMMHFTEGNPAATFGSITFTQYSLPGSPSFSESLTNINYSPFSFAASTATADFAGTVNGSLTFNIARPPCKFRCYFVGLYTINGVHSHFTIDPGPAAHALYKCGSAKHACLG